MLSHGHKPGGRAFLKDYEEDQSQSSFAGLKDTHSVACTLREAKKVLFTITLQVGTLL